MEYPEVLFNSTTRDDRAHPDHPNKRKAKMRDMGYKTYYFENTEHGPANSTTKIQRAKKNVLFFSYLLKKLN